MKNIDIIAQLEKSDQFAAIDRHFANFIFELSNDADPVLALSAALVSRRTREGNVCVDLNKHADGADISVNDAGVDLRYPDIKSWRRCLEASAVVGKPGDFTPLVLDNKDRLYLHRYWQYENRLAKSILLKIKHAVKHVAASNLNHILSDIFPQSTETGVDWQKVAAAVAVLSRFCVISGGPGTGKTYAVARILVALLMQARPTNLRIVLAAPTGKAAARLAESVQAAKEGFKVDTEILASIPETSSTIHRLLKPIKGTPFFRYNSENPLPVDVVIIDEASMVDLPLMSKLLQAISDETRVILMGDRHQLASVEAGSILGDICGHKQENGYSDEFATSLASITGISEVAFQGRESIGSDLHDHLIYFTRNYRFRGQSGISRLSTAVNAGDADAVVDILKSDQYQEIAWHQMASAHKQQAFLQQEIHAYYSRLHSIADPKQGLAALNSYRILCAVNHGPLGVAGLNQLAMMTVQYPNQQEAAVPLQEWYHGRPILISANDYELDLFNGDVGVAIEFDQEGKNHLYVYFAEDSTGNLRRFRPGRLPQLQSVYAMTIHKSQGSEFDDILIVLPELDMPLLTRELLYTAITRAKRNLSILASESVIRSAVSRRIERTSGLRDALWC